MGIVDKVMGGLREREVREQIHNENTSRHETGPEALALGKPAEYTVDDKIGGTHTRNVNEAVVHENVLQHAHHEVTPIVNRTREETEIHQKLQPVVDKQEVHTHHQHVAPQVARTVQEDITDDHANKYRQQAAIQNERVVGDQTHSTSVNAPVVREHVNKHIIEEITPVIQRQTQRVEHHHTTQQINETHVKAPVVHSTTTNAPITMAEFAGKVGDLAKGHLGSTSHHTTSTGTTGTGIGSGSHTHGTGLGSSHNSGTGLLSGNNTHTHGSHEAGVVHNSQKGLAGGAVEHGITPSSQVHDRGLDGNQSFVGTGPGSNVHSAVGDRLDNNTSTGTHGTHHGTNHGTTDSTHNTTQTQGKETLGQKISHVLGGK